jgi:hypothetical protein
MGRRVEKKAQDADDRKIVETLRVVKILLGLSWAQFY